MARIIKRSFLIHAAIASILHLPFVKQVVVETVVSTGKPVLRASRAAG
jgi:hypothetical protein